MIFTEYVWNFQRLRFVFLRLICYDFHRVRLEFPKIEVRVQNVTVESFVHVGSRALPTIPNFVFNMTEV
jgi:hypothetical protein